MVNTFIGGAVGGFAFQMSSESFDGVDPDRRGDPPGMHGATALSCSGGTVGGDGDGDGSFGAAVGADAFLESVSLGTASGL
jgi:hypothetical protein